MRKWHRCGFVFSVCLVAANVRGIADDTQRPTQNKSPSQSEEKPKSPVPKLERFASEAKPGQQWDANSLKMAFCWCPAGSFLMGSPETEFHRFDDECQVPVTLSHGFWLSKYEVTQAEYQGLMEKNPSQFVAGAGYKHAASNGDTSQFPVECVSWEDALRFCSKLTEREHQAGTLPGDWQLTLPTEAQWEYACRAGNPTATAFGETLSSQQANFDGRTPYQSAKTGNYLKRPAKVGSYPANAWGLCDMHGNVFEWCRDRGYRNCLPGGADPEVGDQSWERIVRGGCWRNPGRECRSARRIAMPAKMAHSTIGFRVAAVRMSE